MEEDGVHDLGCVVEWTSLWTRLWTIALLKIFVEGVEGQEFPGSVDCASLGVGEGRLSHGWVLGCATQEGEEVALQMGRRWGKRGVSQALCVWEEVGEERWSFFDSATQEGEEVALQMGRRWGKRGVS